MDYCSARTQIKSYAPTATGSTLFAKNIDCVTLDADYVGCDTLTVGGVSFTDVPSVINKTRNILDTTSANQTNVVGTLQVPDVDTERITGVGGSTIQFKSSTEHSISNSTGGISLYLTNSTLGTATTNYMGLAIGTSKTSSNNAWQMLYYNTTTGSSNNRLEFKMAGQFVPTMSMINGKVGIANSAPTEALDVTGNAKVNGTLAVTGLISGTISNTVLGTSTSTGDLNSTYRQWSVGGLLPYEMWFSWRNLTASGWTANKRYQLKVVTNTLSPTFDSDSHTTGTNGSEVIDWSGNIIYLWNANLTVSGTNINLCGHIRFLRVPSPSGVTDTLYTVFGVANRRDLNGYVCNLMGVLRLTSGQTISSLQISCDSATGVSCTGYLGYNR